jgi:hypothetical protein
MTSRCFLAVGVLLGVAVTSGCNGFIGDWIILDSVGKRFRAVESGQTREQVVAAVGPPARESSVFRLPQTAGYEAVLREASESRASSFLYWDTGVDEVAVVGLDEGGRVVFKCRAGT